MSRKKEIVMDFHSYMEDLTDEYAKGWEAGVRALYQALKDNEITHIEAELIKFCECEEAYHILKKEGIKYE